MTTVTLTKKGTKQMKAPVKAQAKAALASFQIQDNQDDSFTVFGVDAAGNQVDISGVASLAVSSDNTAILTVDAPVGMTSAMHAVGPVGTVNIVAKATWTDGSVGPFTFTLPVTVQTGPASGLNIVPGTPTVH
jgi:hypothetical protein